MMNQKIYKILQSTHVLLFGALWGVSEIFLGGYLHAKQYHEYGVVMAAIGAAIALTGSVFAEKRGSIILMGVVAAFLKTFSVGSLIFSLIIAIIAEALVGELALLFLGKNKLSFAVAGSSMVAYCFFHRFISEPLLYGKNLKDVFVSFIALGDQILGIPVEYPATIIAVFFLIYIALGSAGGYIAWNLTRYIKQRIGLMQNE